MRGFTSARAGMSFALRRSSQWGLWIVASTFGVFASRFLSMVDFNKPFTADEFIRQWADHPHFSPLEVGPQQRTTMYKDILAAHAAAT